MTYSEISIDDVISRVKMQLRLGDTTEWDNYFDIVINEGIRHLDTASLLIPKTCKIKMKDGKGKLPCGFYKLIAVRKVSPECGDMIYVNKTFLAQCGCTTEDADYTGTFQIIGNCISLNSDEDIDEISIAYTGANVDKHGKLLIYEHYERALFNYACWQYTLAFAETYNQYVIENYSITWTKQKGWVRGTDAKNAFDNAKLQIKRFFNAVLVNKDLLAIDSNMI